MAQVSILFVCTANICRSPTAEGIAQHYIALRGLAEVIRVASAGNEVPHSGFPPDTRAINIAEQNDVDLKKYKCSPVISKDFEEYDYIIAMDKVNYEKLSEKCPNEYLAKLHNMIDYIPEYGYEGIPDPYYGNLSGFNRVYGLLDEAVKNLLDQIDLD